MLTILRDSWRRSSLHGDTLAAATSFFMLLSVAPLMVMAVGVASLVFDRAAARAALVHGVRGVLSEDASALVAHALESMQQQDTWVATVIATLMLLWAASRLFVQVQEALNLIWGVGPSAGNWHEYLRYFALKRAVSLGMVIACGALLLASLAIHTVLTALGDLVLTWVAGSQLPAALLIAQENAISLALLTVLFAMVFMFLPDARVHMRDVAIGALLTAVLTLAGTRLLGLYFTRIAPVWLHGALGSLGAFMLWTYYLARMFFFGAAFTRAWSEHAGRVVEPRAHAQLFEQPRS